MTTLKQRQRMLDKAAEMASGTYCRKFVAPIFQELIRAEAAAITHCVYIKDCDTIVDWTKPLGRCVCITCGKSYPWKGTNLLDTGHFIASRRNSILLLEENCAPQCKHCNRDHHGRPLEFEQWMRAVRGQDTIDRLKRLKTESVTFDREQLVDMRIEFARRLKVAELKMKGTT